VRKVDQIFVSLRVAFVSSYLYYKNLQADVLMEYKTLGNWRQIINVNNRDVCKLLSMPEGKCGYEILNELFGGFILHRCPYLPGRLQVVNITSFEVIEIMIGSEPAVENVKDDWIAKILRSQLFKGEWRITITLKTKTDQKVVQVIAIYSIVETTFETF